MAVDGPGNWKQKGLALIGLGRLRLDDEIQTYVPAFPRKQWPVTLRQLMGHVAGVRHYRSAADDMPTAHCRRASDGLQLFAAEPLQFEPETQYSYSTFGWILVSASGEAVADEPFFTLMRAQIFEPLGMKDTVPDAPRERAFLSTPSDLVRFGMALNAGTLLQRATVKKLQTPQELALGKPTDYGLGWMLETFPLAGEPTRMAGHASRTPLGCSTSFMTFPERGLVVAVTWNTSFANTRSIALTIAEAFATVPLLRPLCVDD